MNRTEILNTRETVKGLCKLARELGYKDPCYQLINSDGSVVGDLLCMLDDNPGLCQAMIERAARYFGDDDEEEIDEEDEPEASTELAAVLYPGDEDPCSLCGAKAGENCAFDCDNYQHEHG